MSDLLAYCQQIAAPAGSSRYYSLRFCERSVRQQLLPVYALQQTIRSSADNFKEPDMAHQSLHWWMEELNHWQRGKPNHPITQALAHHCPNIKFDYLQAMILAADQEIGGKVIQSMTELSHYAHQALGLADLATLDLLGQSEPAAIQTCQRLAVIQTIVKLIAYLRNDLLHNKYLLPQELCQKHQVTETSLEQRQMTPELRACLSDLCTTAEQQFADIQLPSKALLSQYCYTKLQLAELALIQKHDFPIFQHHILLTPIKKFFMAWWAYRTKIK